jgi:hypothetical protein
MSRRDSTHSNFSVCCSKPLSLAGRYPGCPLVKPSNDEVAYLSISRVKSNRGCLQMGE